MCLFLSLSLLQIPGSGTAGVNEGLEAGVGTLLVVTLEALVPSAEAAVTGGS